MKIVFIFSQPRSGSTILQKILSNNNQIHADGETWLLLPILQTFKKNWYRNESSETNLSRKNIKKLLSYYDLDETYKKKINQFYTEIYTNILTKNKKSIYIEKTPRYGYFVKEISEIFPESYFIFLKRNPAEVLNSILKDWVKYNIFSLYKYIDDLFLLPKKLCESINYINNKKIIIHYSDMIEDQNKTFKKIADFLGVENNFEFSNKKHASSFWTFGDKRAQKTSKIIKSNNSQFFFIYFLILKTIYSIFLDKKVKKEMKFE